MSVGPLFTVLTPVYQPDHDHFRAMVDSVLAQTDPDWELVLVLDGPHPADFVSLARSYSDPRIRVVEQDENRGISAASNAGLAEATGSFVALLDNDDTLAPFALAACREVIETWPDVDVMYSDEDKLDLSGRRFGTFSKPQFSPDWLRCHMYLGHLGVYRRSLVEEVGGFRSEFDGSQDHDLALRTTERARRVAHIPRVLYHWRQSATSTASDPESKSWAYEAAVRVVQEALDRQGVPAKAERRPDFSGVVHIEPALAHEPRVSIIVPTSGQQRVVIGQRIRLIDRCLASIRDHTSYSNYEVVVVVDSTAPPGLEQQLGSIAPDRLHFVRNPRPFNFSEACNLGRDHATGDVLVFLNDDTEVVTNGWLARLTLFAGLDGVGAVGVKLLYSDGTIQHIGLVSRDGMGHRDVGLRGDIEGPYSSYVAQSNVLGVTGACLAVKADRFDSVGGFSTKFPLAFNDVDLCLKLYHAGFRTVLDPQVTLIHHESSSRNPAITDYEFDELFRRWRFLLDDDPYDNPHMRFSGYAHLVQEHPPAAFMELKEKLGIDAAPPRIWPPDPLASQSQ